MHNISFILLWFVQKYIIHIYNHHITPNIIKIYKLAYEKQNKIAFVYYYIIVFIQSF